ncbi:DUF1257 domain-containing protein [Microcoleus sp. F8_C2]
MSGYKRFTVKVGISSATTAPRANVKALVKALADMGFSNVEVHQTLQNLYGYQGDVRPEKGQVILRRQYIGSASNDIGFNRRQDGTFEAIISEYDRSRFSLEWLNQLAQRYNYHAGTTTGTGETITAEGEIMSGRKEFEVTAGISSVVAAMGSVAAMPVKAYQAYQERVRKEQEVALKKEQEIRQKIAQIRSRPRSNSSQPKVPVPVKLLDPIMTNDKVKPVPTTTVKPTKQITQTINTQTPASDSPQRRQVESLKSQLPSIKSEYQALIDQQLLDSQTVQLALQRTEQALNADNLESAEAHLQALDDARIKVTQQLREQWQEQVQYLQERLDGLRNRIPQTLAHDLQVKLDQARTNWQQISEADLTLLHQEINEIQAQADRVQEAAQNLQQAWQEAGYIARILETDDGDAVIEVETHEDGVNTLMRVQFNGEEIELNGPSEEPNSCVEGTQRALQIFQEQGYLLEWTHLDEEPVPEEWRWVYSPSSQGESSEAQSATPPSNISIPKKSQRRMESQGY